MITLRKNSTSKVPSPLWETVLSRMVLDKLTLNIRIKKQDIIYFLSVFVKKL